MKATHRSKRQTQSLSVEEVLRYTPYRVSRSTVRRYYERWREQQGLPVRCDMPDCQFYKSPLQWQGKDLPYVLDHENGNPYDNRPKNLRYLCPNCDSQQPTRGGKNKGRVREVVYGGFVLIERGKRQQHIVAEAGKAIARGLKAAISVTPRRSKK